MLGLNLPYLLCREGNDGKEMGRHLECDQNSEVLQFSPQCGLEWDADSELRGL